MKRTIRVLIWIALALLVAFIAFAVYVRAAGDDAKVWHVDPVSVTEHGAENDFIVTPTGEGADMASPVFDMAPDKLLERFRTVAMAAPRTTILGERDGFATFVQRTKLMAYPDYISVRAVAVEGGSALHVYSRSRYGKRDFKVNEKRVLSWLNRL